HRQLHQWRAVGPPDRRVVGDDLPARSARPAAPPEPALRSRARRSAGDRGHAAAVLAHPRALSSGSAGRCVHRADRGGPLRGRILPRTRCRSRPPGGADRPQPGPVADHSADPGGPGAGGLVAAAAALGERAAARRRLSAVGPEPPPAQRSLADTFRRLIEADGPISLQQFMGESNARYYAHKDPLGRDGDFVTAPEISQMFGELVGLWLADMWLRAGSPANPVYVELGPGRGTLASDALRAMKRCGLEPEVHLVEGSPALRALQRAALPGARFHDDLGTVPDDRPLLLVANEFLDALPVRQLVRAPEGWREVVVATDADG